MDKKGEIDHLSKIAKPNIGVITNISYAHSKNFNNLFDIAKAKSEIINNINTNGKLILNKDDKFFDFFSKIANKKNLKIISFGKNKSNIKIKKLKNKNISVLEILVNSKIYKLKINNNLLSSIENILASLAVISLI